MKDKMKVYGDTYTEYNVMLINLQEMNLKLITDYKQKRLYDLFIYLVNKGYIREAADIWDRMIKNHFFVRHTRFNF